jgi:adenine-specific DNA-methyltransferase
MPHSRISSRNGRIWPGGADHGVQIITAHEPGDLDAKHLIYQGNCVDFLSSLPDSPLFDLVVTSPPYNIGKPYEQVTQLAEYVEFQTAVIKQLARRLKPGGSICWEVGNYVIATKGNRGAVYPLDFLFHPIFSNEGFVLRNRIIWRFGHGLHCRYRFSGRYETILWYTRDADYYFDLDAVRIKPKYPGKRHYKGPNLGKLSSNPKGKNPEDVWDVELVRPWDDIWEIPNVKSNHVEKQAHPCQFPVGLVQRLLLAFCPTGGLVFDPFCGVGSTGVAAAIHNRAFWGCEIMAEYARNAKRRIEDALKGQAQYRPHDRPIYDHRKSPLSKIPTDVEGELFK